MPSVIEELPKKIWGKTKESVKVTFSYLKKWHNDYQRKKVLLEAQQKKQQEINSIANVLSNNVRMLYKEDNSLIEQNFNYAPFPIHENKTVVENGKEVTKSVLVGYKYIPQISHRRSERLGKSEIEVYGDFYELQFYGDIDEGIKHNLNDRWKSFINSSIDKATTFAMVTEKGEKKLIFAVVDKETESIIRTAKINNIIF